MSKIIRKKTLEIWKSLTFTWNGFGKWNGAKFTPPRPLPGSRPSSRWCPVATFENKKKNRFNWATVDGRNPANRLTGSLSQYVHGFVNPWCCGISSINRNTKNISKKRNRISLSFLLFTRDFRESPSLGHTSSIPSWQNFLGLKKTHKEYYPKSVVLTNHGAERESLTMQIRVSCL